MKVLLMAPPFYTLLGHTEWNYPPLGLAYLAASLEQEGHEAAILNADNHAHRFVFSDNTTLYTNVVSPHAQERYRLLLNDGSHPIWRRLGQEIRDFAPDLVGISILSSTYAAALNLARLVKEVRPGVPVVFGGVHPTAMPEEVLRQQCVDIVVRGEGEETITELAAALERGQGPAGVAGLSYKREGRIAHNAARPLLESLDSLPFPAKHRDLDCASYPPDAFGRVMTARGCPFSCIYCASHTLWGRHVRTRSPDSVVREIAAVKEHHRTGFFAIDDDTFNIDRRFVVELCQLMVARELDVEWWCEVRAHPLDAAMLREMRGAGCRRIAFGVEVGNDEMLQRVRKRVTRDQILQAARLLHRVGIRFDTFFMVGFPWENKADIRDAVGLMKKVNPTGTAFLNVATPYPGTELYRELTASSPLPVDWREFYHCRRTRLFEGSVKEEDFGPLLAWADDEFRRQNRKNELKALLRRARNPVVLAGWLRRYWRPKALWRKACAVVRG